MIYKVIPRTHVKASAESTTRLHPCLESVCRLPLTSTYRCQYPRSLIFNCENHIATSRIKRYVSEYSHFRKILAQPDVEAKGCFSRLATEHQGL